MTWYEGFVVAPRWLRVVAAVGILFVAFSVWLENLSIWVGFKVEEEEQKLLIYLYIECEF